MASGKWASSNRRQRLPPDWPALRLARLEYDNYRCVICGAPANEVDHVKRGDDHSFDNLQSLCRRHHREKTAQEAVAARVNVQAQRKRPTTTHPGLIQPDTKGGG